MRSPPQILLVEDNEANRYLAQFLLEREGFAVSVAITGKQALEMARRDPPDLVVMDILIWGSAAPSLQD